MIGLIMRKLLLFTLLFICAILALGVDPFPATAQAGSAYDMIAAVNQFRAANGLAPLQNNSALMAAAQAHSEYQASIGTVTHTGAGGSRALDRARAAGFGGGAQIYVSENIAGGISLSPNTAIYTYWQDALHLSTMLNPNSQYVGAGAAIVGNYVYYTLDVGYIVGDPGGGSQPPIGGTYPSPGPTAIAFAPFVVSTPRKDGAIVHEVGYGQTLIGIANSYEIPLEEILTLNILTKDSLIYPGEKIYIRPPNPNTSTPSPTEPPATKTQSPSPTSKNKSPTPRATFTQAPSPTTTPTATPTPLPADRQRLMFGTVLLAAFVLVAVIVSGMLKRD
jgi:LysM repeat protein